LCRNCLVKYSNEGKIEGKIEVTGRRKRRHKQLLPELKAARRYCELKKEALDRTLWRTGFGRSCGPVGKTNCGTNERNAVANSVMLFLYFWRDFYDMIFNIKHKLYITSWSALSTPSTQLKIPGAHLADGAILIDLHKNAKAP